MKRLLMCEPTGYDVNYVINPYMKHSVVDGALALRQWRSVKDALVDAGANVVTVPGDERYPDMVFAANAAQVIDVNHFKAAILAKFRSEHRAGETKLWADRMLKVKSVDTIIGFNSWHDDGHCTPYFEGQGDVVTVKGMLTDGVRTPDQLYHYIVGYGQRTSGDGMRLFMCWLNKLNAQTVTAVRLVSPHFYHLDTCLFAGSKGALWIPDAMEEGQHRSVTQALRFEQSDYPIIDVTVEEGKTLCCNMVEASPGTVVSGLLPDRVRSELHNLGYKTVEVDTSEFLKSGGSVRCMTLDL